MEKNKIIIEDDQNRLDVFLSQNTELSRERAKKLIVDEFVTVNGNVVKAKQSLKIGDVVEIAEPEAKEITAKAQKMDLDIVYEDDDLIVINKANGVVVHPAPGHPDGTLVNGLIEHCKNLSGIGGEIRPGVVHRIDRETTGILMFAKNDFTHRGLSKQLEEKTVNRKYLALVHGVIWHKTAEIDAPIGRDGSDRKKMCVTDQNAKEARTFLTVIERFDNATLVELKLETGRTHQIRVHMSWIGHPVIGDPVYGNKKDNDNYGQYLHAKTLGFVHPRSGQYMEFTRDIDQTFKEKVENINKK